MRLTFALVMLLLAAGLTGCLGDEQAPQPVNTTTTPSEPAADETLEAITYACPGQPSDQASNKAHARAGEPCIVSLRDPLRSLAEPFVAIDRADPDRIALGVNAFHTTEAVGSGDASPVVQDVHLTVYISQDGGASWSAHAPPLPAAREGTVVNTNAGDPTLAWGPNGTLHVAGLFFHSNEDGSRVFHVAYDANEEAWSEPVALSQGGDRPWLAYLQDRLVLAWQEPFAERILVKVSQDGGRSWAPSDAPAIAEGCYTASPVVDHEGALLLACATRDGSEVRVLTLEPDAVALSPRGTIETERAIWPRLVAPTSGPLVATWEQASAASLTPTTELEANVGIATSPDGGRSWSSPIALGSLSATVEGFSAPGIRWQAADAWGAVHLMVTDEGGENTKVVRRFTPGPKATPVVHVVLDPSSLALIHEQALKPQGQVESARLPPILVPGSADDYHGMDFARDHGVAAWTVDRGIDLTRIEGILS